MVDTVKLLIPIDNPLVLDGSRFTPTLSELVSSTKFGKAYLNPSTTYAKIGKSMPRLTMNKRPSKFGSAYELAVEFSAPKMLHNNNFDELTEDDFEPLVKALQEKLYELSGIRLFSRQIASADVGAWHPSKNIVFLSYTACQTILNTIAKLDISRTYQVQKTDFRDGHVVHIHCNSLDVAFYDKMADYRRSKLSEKQSVEKDNIIQLNLFESLAEYHPLEVLRYEVRFVGKASIKRAFPQLEVRTFESLFKKQLCQDVLLKHWKQITSSIDMLALDIKQPYELLQNYLEENQNVTPQTALAAVTGLLIANQVGVLGLRNVLEARYGAPAWYRIKPLLKSPQAYRYTYFQHVDEALERFTRTRMSQFIEKFDKTVK